MERSFAAARAMMDKAGFKILVPIKVSVDPQLPFMGYTMPQGGSFSIVVSGGSVGSGMLEGLLVHEMSHVYRMQTKHPSHNPRILGDAVDRVARIIPLVDYQQKILHDVLNDVQDLYADDIAFRVLRVAKAPFLKNVTEFLQSWVKDEPVNTKNALRNRWENAGILVHNARAIAQMRRHKVEDVGNRAVERNNKFLAGSPPEYDDGFRMFRNKMLYLREEFTVREFQVVLAEHLKEFILMVEIGLPNYESLARRIGFRPPEPQGRILPSRSG